LFAALMISITLLAISFIPISFRIVNREAAARRFA
jgi:hypothetical protein